VSAGQADWQIDLSGLGVAAAQSLRPAQHESRWLEMIRSCERVFPPCKLDSAGFVSMPARSAGE